MDDNIEEEVLQEEEEELIEVEVDETDCKVENDNKPKAASDSDFEEDSDDEEEEIEALQASLRLDVVNRQPDGSASVRVKIINVILLKFKVVTV